MPDTSDTRDQRPLAGVRVLDLTRVLSGPHATRTLVDLGAEVIKVEPPAGDLTRFTNPRIGSMATYFAQQNTGKRNISLDMSQHEADELLARLAERCDVLIENFRPGVMERMGLGYDTLAARHPGLIYASINGYGSTGPWTHRRAYAPVVGAESGLTKDQGDAHGGTYVNDPHSHADLYTSLECVAAVLAALYQRERTGRGQHIDISMAQTMLYVNEHLHDQLYDGPVGEQWIRSFQPGDYAVLTTADGGTLVVSGHPAERGTFDRFMDAIGRPDLIDDERFADVARRLERLGELHDLLRAWAASMPDVLSVEERLAEFGLASGPLRSARELAATDWAREREAIVEVPDRSGGTIKVPNSPWRFSAAAADVTGEPRFRGEDNRAVLAELLDLSEAELDDLEARGVLSARLPRG